MLSEPVPLTISKQVPMILAAARRTWTSLRSLGATGCIVEHYCWDRAGISALERECRRWHLSQPIPEAVRYPEGIREHLEFVLCTPCALHDSQNAFRWAYLDECQDRSLMRDIYIAVESLRNSADLLESRMNSWVAGRLRFVDGRDASWTVQRRVLLEGLDVQPELVEVLLQLELAWEGGQICVRAGAQVLSEPFYAHHRCRSFGI